MEPHEKDALKTSIIIHGPEAVDTGLALKVIEMMRALGPVKAVMSGYTGVAAVVDACLEDRIDISKHRVPSLTLIEEQEKADLLVLVNFAKSRESALRFGCMVFARSNGRITKPYIQVDNGILIEWFDVCEAVADLLIDRLCLEKVTAPRGGEDSASDWRTIGGVLPGENIWVNGVVVGRALNEGVRIGRDDSGHLIAEGISLKPSGVKRLGKYDPSLAHVRSGMTRRTSASARIAPGSKDEGVFLIDHDAEGAIYRCRDASLVVTVGDDTSRVAGSILSRFGVPVVAITDGDEDGITNDMSLAPGSVVFRLKSGNDDLLGAGLRRVLFHGKDHLRTQIMSEEVAAKVREMAADVLLWERWTP